MISSVSNHIEIRDDAFVTEIVNSDYRTAQVFAQYGIDYCCGGRWPLDVVCGNKGLDLEQVKTDLISAVRGTRLPYPTDFNNWPVDFLLDYIVYVHHAYLTNNMGFILSSLERFADSHNKKFDYLPELVEVVHDLKHYLVPHISYEEQVIFPYIKQLMNAYESREPYAKLLVRTLKKPIEKLLAQDKDIGKFLRRMRELTGNFTTPANTCISHKVCFSQLRELNNDLVEHIYLENGIIFPKAVAMESELLQS